MEKNCIIKMHQDLGFSPEEIVWDGKVHRFGKKNRGWYIADLWSFQNNEYSSAIYSDFSSGERYVWHSWDGKRGPKKKDPDFLKIIEERKTKRENETRDKREKVAIKAKRIWGASQDAKSHKYLVSKNLKQSCFGARVRGANLVIPVVNFEGETRSLLFISPEGKKRFLAGGEKSGCMFLIGSAPTTKVYIAEGFSTAATVHAVTGDPVLVAFDAGNLPKVAKAFRERDPDCDIVICADNDLPSGPKRINTGVYYATSAAKEARASVVVPDEAGMDFNDLYQKHGGDRVKHDLKATGVTKQDFKYDLQTGFFTKVAKGNNVFEKPNYNRLGSYFKHILNFKYSDESSYIYQNGFYRLCTPAELDHLIEKLTLGQCDPWEIGGFASKIKSICYHPHGKDAPPDGFINLNNCVLNVRTREVLQHSPKYFFKYKLQHDFDPQSDCKIFKQFLWTSFEGDDQLMNLIGEIMGYTLMGGDPVAHKAFVFYGEGRNGKSTLLSTIRGLLGQDAVCSVSLKNLDKPFSMVQLDGKLANIVDESPNKIDPEGFKNAVGGGYVTAAHKGKPEYPLKVNARLIFACNRMPSFGESSTAIKDRLVFVPFENYIKDKDRDTDLERKLSDSKEMSGVLNFALDGMTRFVTNGFTQSSQVERLKEEYEEESDSVLFWALERLEHSGDGESLLSTDDAFQDFLAFCRLNNMNAMGKTTFGRRLKSALRALLRRRDQDVNRLDSLYKGNSNGPGRGWWEFRFKFKHNSTNIAEFLRN